MEILPLGLDAVFSTPLAQLTLGNILLAILLSGVLFVIVLTIVVKGLIKLFAR